jgi:DNA-binding MarR family transcriptional regulator
VQLSFIVQSVLGRVADGLGLSVTQLRMLAVLEDREIGMLQLAGILELEKSSTTGLVDRAVRRGLVRRVAVPGNRRAVNVTNAPAGQELARTARSSVRAEINAMSGSLGPVTPSPSKPARDRPGQHPPGRAASPKCPIHPAPRG